MLEMCIPEIFDNHKILYEVYWSRIKNNSKISLLWSDCETELATFQQSLRSKFINYHKLLAFKQNSFKLSVGSA